jgi:hypothetical protein
MTAQGQSHEEIETARREIDALRAERNVRLQQRDNALFGYLAAAAALGGVAFGQSAHAEVLLIVPILAPAVTAIVAQHHSVIGRREAFIAIHLMPYLAQRGAAAPSKTGTRRHARSEVRVRTLAHLVALLTPALLGLAMNLRLVRGATWAFACACTVVTAGILWSSHRQRMHSIAEIDAAPTPAR